MSSIPFQISPSCDVWRLVWSLKVPPKFKLFLWKACHNILPSCVILRSKRFDVSVVCPVFHAKDESVFHVLVSCQFATLFWLASAVGFSRGVGHDFSYWLLSLFTRFSVEECNSAAMTL